MKRRLADNLKRIGLWAVVIFTLISSVGLGVFINPAVAENNQVSDAATKQLVAQKFARCIGDWKVNDAHGHGISVDHVNKGKVFKGRDVNVGRWFEEEYYNEGLISLNNGQVSCTEDMWNAFIKTFDLGDSSALMCDKSSDTGNGFYANGLFQSADGSACNTSALKKPVSDEEALAFIGKIYDASIEGNPYAQKWADINTYGPEVGYELYQRDFLTQCSAKLVDDDTNAGKVFSAKVKVVEADGSITEKFAVMKSGANENTKAYSYVGSSKITCSDLITKMNDYAEKYADNIKEQNKTDDPATGGSPGSDSSDVDDPTGGKSGTTATDPCENDDPNDPSIECLEQKCFQEAGSLGWIICPIVFGLGTSDHDMYSAVEPLLRTNESIIEEMQKAFSEGTDGGSIYSAWNTFRNLSNIAFVIFFLFVIFSQLTGFGIDNYGIKKMLPKLIISAILINLSFVLCAVVIDAAQIIGGSITNMFVSISPKLDAYDVGAASSEMGEFLGKILKGSLGAIGISALLTGWTVIIPILLFVLTVGVSVIFALIVLGLRQAIVILLIVVSPMAIVFYALPNTQNIFKKWVDIFKNIIMLYPICGALVGGGYFASHVMLQTYGTGGEMNTVIDLFMTILAGLLCVVPYFMIPSLTRKAVDGIGSLGSKLGNIGNRAGSKLSNGINNSRTVQNARQNAREAADARRGWAYANTLGRLDKKKLESGKQLSRGAARRYTNAMNAMNTKANASVAARKAQSEYSRMQGTGFQAALSSANMAEADTAVKNFETMISAGDYAFDYTDENGERHSTLNAQDNAAIGKALEHELTNGDGSDASNAKIRALSNALAGKGKDGRNLMYEAVKRAQDKGASAENIKTFSSNILNNHGGAMKDNYRPIYELAKATAATGTAYKTDKNGNFELDADGNRIDISHISNYDHAGISSLTSSDMANMDIQQLTRLADYAAANPGDKDARVLGRLVGEAMANEQVQKNEKTLAQFQRISDAVSSTPAPSGAAREGEELKVREAASNANTSAQMMGTQGAAIDKYVTGVNNRVKSGDLKPEEGERMIQRAHEYVDQKNTQNGQNGQNGQAS